MQRRPGRQSLKPDIPYLQNMLQTGLKDYAVQLRWTLVLRKIQIHTRDDAVLLTARCYKLWAMMFWWNGIDEAWYLGWWNFLKEFLKRCTESCRISLAFKLRGTFCNGSKLNNEKRTVDEKRYTVLERSKKDNHRAKEYYLKYLQYYSYEDKHSAALLNIRKTLCLF